VKAADTAGIDIILDAPFNHAALDVELAPQGQSAWGGANPTDEIRNVEARFFSRSGEYDLGASSVSSVAHAPYRVDFGKWDDVIDIYFGRYAALVANTGEPENYKNEEDGLTILRAAKT
jgi:hypothetical protein